ncbi:uncharacterized protein [Miscanthus floridulus]|uniref:uncharacterized protein n=1 Tax=Miscanthus floridulus TaxID=154761 RepID=UPI00345A3C1F
MDITQYTGRLADALRDVGQPVRETSQVLNMLRGLSSKYRHAISAITAKQPPHTFLSARSYLLLEEHYDKEQANTAAHQALVATGAARSSSTSSPGTSDGGSSSATTPAPARSPAVGHGTPPRHDNKKGRGRGRGCGGYQHTGSGGSNSSAPRPPAGWAPGVNPWTGMVQAWPMPFRVPGAGVLGSRPGAPPQHAYFAGSPPLPAPGAVQQHAPPPDVWNNQALLAALVTSGVPPSGPQAAEWFMDTGATSHMASNAGHPDPNGAPPM